MKRLLAMIFALLLCITFTACDKNGGGSSESTSDVIIKVMLTPDGRMEKGIAAKVTDKVNERVRELGSDFQVEFCWSGENWIFDDWGFSQLDLALQNGTDIPDIIPAHAFSGETTYYQGAANGTYLRLDDPENNLLEQYGQDLYADACDTTKAIATVPGVDGFGIYGYVIEHRVGYDQGYLVNVTELEELGFTLNDFSTDITTWEYMFAAYKEKYPERYPLNFQYLEMDRIVNNIEPVKDDFSPLGIVFDHGNIADTDIKISSRYENQEYMNFINVMDVYYEKGYLDNAQWNGWNVSDSFYNNQDSGNFLISTYGLAYPDVENKYSQSASEAQGREVQIAYISVSSVIHGLGDNSGLAVHADTEYAEESVTFLNMLASDPVIADLVSEGIEGESYAITNGMLWRIRARGGWSMSRYSVVGCNSGATPLGDADAEGREWIVRKEYNNNAAVLPSTGWEFNADPIKDKYEACRDIAAKYIGLGMEIEERDPIGNYDALIEELKDAGIDEVVAEANRQYQEFVAAKNTAK